jgi:hypothetical protein
MLGVDLDHRALAAEAHAANAGHLDLAIKASRRDGLVEPTLNL